MATIDERVVEMRFDNKQFESGIKTSTASLDNLKRSLNVDSSNALSGMAASVQTIADRFSTLGVIGMTALQNITSAAMNAGTQLLQSLTVEPIAMGFQEYETKMNAITTILTNTASKGTKLEDVNRVLGELNEYADQTIYNFAEMTRNVGTFTAAGVDLDVSAGAIKGIANLAAGSGSNAQQASTAMYQLSQALAEGRVSLQTWNSVVNAGLGGELFQHALVDEAVRLGDITVEVGDNIKNGTIAFRQAIMAVGGKAPLLDISTQNLLNTFNRFAEDESLIKAATQVKTFTQLLGTMQESVQSGWAQSWEFIIGDREQAAAFLTAINDGFSDIMGSSTEARNATLQFWNENGGRDAVIQGLANAFNALKDAINPIIEAFQNIFPPITGEQLVAFSEGFRDLTENFKVSDTTANLLRSTFQGLFSIFDIIGQVLGAVFGGFINLISSMAPVGSTILSITAYIGDLITSFAQAARETELFEGIVNKISQVFILLGDVISGGISAISGFFQGLNVSFPTLDTEWFTGFVDKIKNSSIDLSGVSDVINNVINVVTGVLTTAGVILSKIGSMISNVLKTIGSAISEFFGGSFNIGSLLQIIQSGFLVVAAKEIINFVKNIGDALENNNIVGGITNLLSGVGDALKTLEMSVKADVIQKIAISIGILAAALLIIASIDENETNKSLAAITILFADLMGSMILFDKQVAGGVKGLTLAATGMILMSVAILILTSALKKISEIDPDTIIYGIGTITSLMLGLVGTSKLMGSHSSSFIGAAASLVIFAAAINLLVGPLETLGTMNQDDMIQGLAGLIAMMLAISLMLNNTDFHSIGINAGLGLLAFSGAVTILANAVNSLGTMSLEQMVQGLTGLTVILLEIVVFTELLRSSGLLGIGAGLIVVGAGLLVVSKAVESMGSLSWDQIGKGLAGIAGSLLLIAAAVQVMPNLILTGAGLILVGGALLIISGAMKIFGSMSWEEIGKGLTALGGSLGILAVALNLMTGTLAGSAALVIASAALTLLTPNLILLGGMSWDSIGAGLAVLAGALGILAVAGIALGPAIPGLLGLGAALALVGVGILALGAGLTGIGVGIAALIAGITSLGSIIAAQGASITTSISLIISTITAMIPTAISNIGQGIIGFAKVITAGAPEIANATLAVLQAIITAIVGAIPMIVNGVGQLIMALLNALVTYGPQIITAALTLLAQLLVALTQALPALVSAGVGLMVGFIDGMANGIRENAPKIMEAVRNLMSSIIEFAITALSEFASMIPVVGDKLSEGLDKAKLKVQETLAPQTMQQVGADGANALVAGIESAAPAAEGAGVTLGTSANTGVESILAMLGDVGATGGNAFASGLSGTSGEANAAGALVSGQGVAGLMANSGLFGTSGTTSGSSYAAALAGTSGEAGAAGGVLSADAVAALMSNTDMFTGAGNVDVTAFLGGMEQGGSNANESGASVSGQAVEGMESVTDEFTGVGTEQGKKYTTEIDNNKDEAKAAGITVSSEAVTGLKSNYENFKAAGKADGEGYVLGLRESMNEARIAGFELGEASLTGTTTAIDSNSPSKEAEKIGVDYGDGYILGIGTMIPLALTAGMKLGEASREGLEFGTDNADFFNMGAKTGELFVSGLNSMGEAIKASMSLAFGADEEVTKNMNEKIDGALQTIESRIDSYTNTATDRLSVLSSETDVTVEEMISNLQKNQEALMEWANNIALLAEKGLDEGLLEELRAAGPESAGQVRALVDASASELAELNTVFAQGGAVASQALATSVGQAAPLMQQEGQNLVDALATALTSSTSLNDAMATLIGSAKNAGAANVAEFASLGSEMATSFTTALETQAAAAQTSGSSVGTAAVTGLKTNQAEYVATGQKGGTDFNLGLGSTSTAANQSGIKVTTEAEQGIKSNEEVYGQTGDKYGKDFADELDNAAPQAKTAGQTLANAGVEGVNSRVSEFRKAGQNAGKGFVDGLAEYIDEAENVGRRMASAALTSLEDALDERSPSKETEKRGIYFGEGFINGIKAMVSKVGTMTASMGNNALDALRNAIHQAASLVSSDLDLTPTIRPVLDLSEIQNGSRNLDSIFSAERTIGLSRNMVSNSTASKVLAAEESLAKNAQSPQIQFIQNNTSPKALSRIEIYRQTRNLFALQRGVVESV